MLDLRAQILQKIKDNRTKSIGIIMHNKPDGDAIGSAVALEKALKKMGKRVVDIIIHDKINSKFAPFIGDKRVNKVIRPPEGRKYDILFMIDFSDPERTMRGLRRISKSIIVIDHHTSNEPYGDIYLCENAPSTGVIVYELIKKLVPIDKDIANAIYLSIRSDTNGFTNSNTTYKAHKIASELISKGACTELINTVYETKSISFVKLMGNTLPNIVVDKKYKIAYLVVTRDNIRESGALEEEVSSLINEFRYMEGIDISYLFIEGISNVRISGRSRNMSVNKILENFGGGGHPKAAGCAIKGAHVLDVANEVVNFTIECIDNNLM